ncbi:MAG: thioredoxin-disulfide reductase, partial [Candidatus Levybacteria bacterium]|nr:thioredoxin-disulfide reductase [Candidatus Levybacteria bacterium]
YDVIIIGSGPAGLTAAIYTTRANLKTLLIAGGKWGGQLQLTTDVENYPGFPEGIQGPDLMTAMRKQAERFGTEFVDADFTSGDFTRSAASSKGGQAGQAGPFKVIAGENEYEGKSVIVATGADTKWLGVPGEKEKIGRGVSSCAPCDAPFFRGKNVIVVGGGDSAMEEALVLTSFANSVIIMHRGDGFRASEIMQKRVKESPKIKILYNSEVKEILGDQKVEKVRLVNNKTNGESEMPIDGVFVAIGHIPNSKVFEGIDRDERGFIKVQDHYRTNVEGVFVAGDVHDAEYKQAVTAAGFGCAAALEAQWWLAGLK